MIQGESHASKHSRPPATRLPKGTHLQQQQVDVGGLLQQRARHLAPHHINHAPTSCRTAAPTWHHLRTPRTVPAYVCCSTCP